MRLVRPALTFAVASWLAACQFEATGDTGGSATTTATGSSSDTTSGPGSTTEGSTSSTSNGSTPDASSSSTTEPMATGGSSGAPIDDCDPAPMFTQVVTLDDATLGPGIMTSTHDYGEYAWSETAEIGLVTFPFEVPCNDSYYLWALVWDEDTSPFADGGNADSFVTKVDVGSEFNWSYGCETLFQVSHWSYERVQIAEPLDCSVETPQVFALAPGIHELTLRNLEAGSFDGDTPGDVAAVARVFVTNDPNYVPDPDTD